MSHIISFRADQAAQQQNMKWNYCFVLLISLNANAKKKTYCSGNGKCKNGTKKKKRHTLAQKEKIKPANERKKQQQHIIGLPMNTRWGKHKMMVLFFCYSVISIVCSFAFLLFCVVFTLHLVSSDFGFLFSPFGMRLPTSNIIFQSNAVQSVSHK